MADSRMGSILILGGPDAGKSNYLGSIWLSLQGGAGSVTTPHAPPDIKYVEDLVEHILQGKFAPHSPREDGRKSFSALVTVGSGELAHHVHLKLPDMSGEVWSDAVSQRVIDRDLMELMKECDGALLLVRVLSDQNLVALDWVTSAELMAHLPEVETQKDQVPTQVFLCELLKFLEMTLKRAPSGRKPRVAVMVTAWDLLDPEAAGVGPMKYLDNEYPMFVGRIDDCELLDVRVFGVSSFGGDLEADAEFREKFYAGEPQGAGYVISVDADGSQRKQYDVCLPLSWACGFDV